MIQKSYVFDQPLASLKVLNISTYVNLSRNFNEGFYHARIIRCLKRKHLHIA